MSAQKLDEGPGRARVVLVVPKQHVKTVKSALERSDQLDRCSRITPESRDESVGNIDAAPSEPSREEDAPIEDEQKSSRESIDAVAPGPTHQRGSSAQEHRFPILEFNVVSGEYVEPSVLENRNRVHMVAGQQTVNSPPGETFGNSTTHNPFSTLQFDAASGEYLDLSAVRRRCRNNEEDKDQNRTLTPTAPNVENAFPRLHFDPGSGEYIDDSVLQERGPHSERMQGEPRSTPGLPSEDIQTNSVFSRLQFDVVSGEYVDQPIVEKGDRSLENMGQQRMRIPTTIPYRSTDQTSGIADDKEDQDFKAELLRELALTGLSQDILVSYHFPSIESDGSLMSKSPIHKALKEAVDALPEFVLSSLGLTSEALVSAFPGGYSVYKPMLLLPHNTFSSDVWRTLLSVHSADSGLLQPVWQHIAEAVGATHVAVNSPIPLQFSTKPTEVASQENTLRSPSNLTPLYGDFGPAPTPETLSSPTPSNFEAALWVTTKQNGIWQTWAPTYTMFSRGNVREKTRILRHPSVAKDFDVPSTAADLYAGIGYFAFSYKKSGEGRQNGIKRVICWELNPWSVEGLRLGAEMNGWTCRIIKTENLLSFGIGIPKTSTADDPDKDFWVYQMSNEDAEYDHCVMGTDNEPKPPVRHVNLGLLPTSKLSWKSAVRILDIERGGWIHAHENVGVKEVEPRTKEVEVEFQRLLDEWDAEKDRAIIKRKVTVEHVEKVKMYAPGVVHCVFDIAVASS